MVRTSLRLPAPAAVVLREPRRRKVCAPLAAASLHEKTGPKGPARHQPTFALLLVRRRLRDGQQFISGQTNFVVGIDEVVNDLAT